MTPNITWSIACCASLLLLSLASIAADSSKAQTEPLKETPEHLERADPVVPIGRQAMDPVGTPGATDPVTGAMTGAGGAEQKPGTAPPIPIWRRQPRRNFRGHSDQRAERWPGTEFPLTPANKRSVGRIKIPPGIKMRYL